MAENKELIRKEDDGSISFGNYELETKTKLSDFEHKGDLYKVKTFKEITKLERNGMFVYESVPGTAVSHFKAEDAEVSFQVEGKEDVQITLELTEDSLFEIYIDGKNVGEMKTNLGGKLNLSVELEAQEQVAVRIVKK